MSGFPDLATSYTWFGLDSNRSYRFSVRAENQAGRSAAATSATLRPLTDKPSVVIISPASGATVKDTVSVQVKATRNPSTKSPIYWGDLYVDTQYVDVDLAPIDALTWDTQNFPDKSYTLTVIVYDRAGKSATATRKVTVNNVP